MGSTESKNTPTQRPVSGETLMTVAELAEFLQLTPSTVYRMVEQGQIPALHIGVRRRSLRFRRWDIERWLDSERNQNQNRIS